MNPKWHFNVQRLCSRARNPENEAFFTAETLDNLSEALVREGIQNSLDAAKRSSDEVRQVLVRIQFEPKASAEVRNYLANIFGTAQLNFEHGLPSPSLDLFGKDCGYLLFEDFGTKGLGGDIEECRFDQATKNAFFRFFRAEGISSKSLGNGGRWGIGKHVFPTASRLHSMLGLTVRDETPNRVLMGSAVVHVHSVNGQDFEPDGWFGTREDSDKPVSPVKTPEFIEEFVKTFGLKRRSEAGLSIIVPSIDERINIEDLRRGIIRNFFWPILRGELVVDLESSGTIWHLDAETLAVHRTLLPANEAAVLEFAAWASIAKPDEHVLLSDPGMARPDWRSQSSILLPDNKLNAIRDRLEKYKRVGVQIPVRVRPKYEGGKDSAAIFLVYIESCRDSGHRTIFVRDGIVIPDVRCPSSMSGFRSIVVVEESSLSGLLGDSEGVNHTQFQKDSPKFHNRYFYGPDTIKFVTRSAYEIMQRLHAAETKGDPDLLLHIFSLPADDGPIQLRKKSNSNQPGPVVALPPSLPLVSPRKFQLDRIKGGFVLRPGSIPIDILPMKVSVSVAYDVRKGNPLSKWANDDFAFFRSPLKQEQVRSVVVTKAEGNLLEVEIRSADFYFSVTGFDLKRDLVVRANAMKSNNEADI